MNPSPYASEEDRLEARRRTFRECKARKAAERKAQKAAVDAMLDELINSGRGPAWRRVMMLDILARQ